MAWLVDQVWRFDFFQTIVNKNVNKNRRAIARHTRKELWRLRKLF